MKRLDLHGDVVASSPHRIDVLIAFRRGTTNREASRGYNRTRSSQAREPALYSRRNGTITEQRIVTSRERFTAVLGNRSPAHVILEASTESEWVAQHLESLGHKVVVADPNYAPMYATRARRVKTDKRDARALADALKVGAYHNAHRVSAERRHVRAELAVREALVRTRTRYVSLAKALVRRDGLRVASSESHLVAKRIASLELSDALASELMPLFQVLAPINEQIAAADRRIEALTKAIPMWHFSRRLLQSDR